MEKDKPSLGEDACPAEVQVLHPSPLPQGMMSSDPAGVMQEEVMADHAAVFIAIL